MQHAQNCKYAQVIAPVAIVDDASWTTIEIDTKGYNYLELIFNLGATDIAMAALKLQESDTSGSGMADITGLVVGTSTDIDGNTSALPSATDDGNVVVFQVDLRGRKRYLDLVATAGDGAAGTFASAVARLSHSEIHPNSTTEYGAETVLRV